MMAAIETYQTIEMSMPASAQQMIDGDYFTSTPEVEVCYFISIPGFSWRPPSVLLIMAHAGSTTMLYTIHPMYDGRVYEFSTSAPGCAF